jgi:hypothetical protein
VEYAHIIREAFFHEAADRKYLRALLAMRRPEWRVLTPRAPSKFRQSSFIFSRRRANLICRAVSQSHRRLIWRYRNISTECARGENMLGLGAAKPVSGQAEDLVKCSTTKVFDFVAHHFFDNYPQWCPQVVELEQLSDSHISVGCRGRQVTRDRGIDSESIFEVTQFDDPQKLEIKGSSEPFRSCYEFHREGDDATRVSFTFELEELELVMRPFQKLIRVALQDGATQTIENIKRLLEEQPA